VVVGYFENPLRRTEIVAVPPLVTSRLAVVWSNRPVSSRTSKLTPRPSRERSPQLNAPSGRVKQMMPLSVTTRSPGHADNYQ
jgi:hypothetical protein